MKLGIFTRYSRAVTAKKCTKTCAARASSCFAGGTYCFFDVLAAVAVVVATAPFFF